MRGPSAPQGYSRSADSNSCAIRKLGSAAVRKLTSCEYSRYGMGSRADRHASSGTKVRDVTHRGTAGLVLVPPLATHSGSGRSHSGAVGLRGLPSKGAHDKRRRADAVQPEDWHEQRAAVLPEVVDVL